MHAPHACVPTVGDLQVRQLTSNGLAPGARLGHAACAVDHSAATLAGAEVWVFGGGDGKVLLRDIWALDPSTCTWRKLKCTGVRPSARIGHSLAYMAVRDSLISCGGFVKGVPGGYSMQLLLLDLATLSWSEVQTCGPPGGVLPSGRLGAAICSLDGGRRVLLFGGSAFGHVLDETLSLDTETMTLSKLDLPTAEGATGSHSRANGAALSIPPFVVHVGGLAGAADAPAMDVLDMEKGCWCALLRLRLSLSLRRT